MNTPANLLPCTAGISKYNTAITKTEFTQLLAFPISPR